MWTLVFTQEFLCFLNFLPFCEGLMIFIHGFSRNLGGNSFQSLFCFLIWVVFGSLGNTWFFCNAVWFDFQVLSGVLLVFSFLLCFTFQTDIFWYWSRLQKYDMGGIYLIWYICYMIILLWWKWKMRPCNLMLKWQCIGLDDYYFS